MRTKWLGLQLGCIGLQPLGIYLLHLLISSLLHHTKTTLRPQTGAEDGAAMAVLRRYMVSCGGREEQAGYTPLATPPYTP